METTRNNEWQITERGKRGKRGKRGNRGNRGNRDSYISTSMEKSTKKTQTKEHSNTSYTLNQEIINNKPSRPNYASIVYKNEDKSCLTEAYKCTEYTTNFPIIQNFRPTCVRNRIPRKNCNSSYDVWEYKYFRHILNLKDIFSSLASKLNIETNSVDFLNVFSRFIRDYSSGEISPYLDDLTEEDKEYYLNFIILRNEL